MLPIDMQVELPFEINGDPLLPVPASDSLKDGIISIEIAIIHTRKIQRNGESEQKR